MRSNSRNSVINTGSVLLSTCNLMLHSFRFKAILSLFIVGMMFAGCGKNSSPEDNIPPAKPVLKPAATFTSESDSLCGPYDQGPTASNGIRLMWNTPTDNDIAEWRIYYRRADSGDQPLLGGTHSAQSAGYQFVLRDLRIQPDITTDSSTTYEYWVDAVDQTGNVSPSSDPFRYRLLRRADGVNVDTTGGLPVFHAQYTYSDLLKAPDRYSIKVRNDSLQYEWLYYRNEYQSQVNVRFNEDGTVNQRYLTFDGRMIPGNYVVYIEFWRGDSAGSVASQNFNYPPLP